MKASGVEPIYLDYTETVSTDLTNARPLQKRVKEREGVRVAPPAPEVEATVRRGLLGQFLTPSPVASLMASFFKADWNEVRLLDAGAGAGALTAALVDRLCSAEKKPSRIAVDAYELDPILIAKLRRSLGNCRKQCESVGISFKANIFNRDFISNMLPLVRNDLLSNQSGAYNLAIVNPPYRKIHADSAERRLLRSVGIETSNLYSGFVALITKVLVQGGELVAITPRSFCNGPYFKPFRVAFLESMSLCRLHIFESRSAAFSRDDVLQENVICHAVKGEAQPGKVVISTSSGAPDSPIVERLAQFEDVVAPNDPERFIHLVTDRVQKLARTAMRLHTNRLEALGLSVSTGRVVDFRARGFLRDNPEDGTAPLIYPCHFNGGTVHWPKKESRKPNAIKIDDQTRGLLVPAGVYVLVKRFTAKEERRRIVACVFDPNLVPSDLVGFENHLNYFHLSGHGMPMELAEGLAAFLNSTMVDVYFRQFSGHTQVNATDLRALGFPSKDALIHLGREIKDRGMPQNTLDAFVEQGLI